MPCTASPPPTSTTPAASPHAVPRWNSGWSVCGSGKTYSRNGNRRFTAFCRGPAPGSLIFAFPPVLHEMRPGLARCAAPVPLRLLARQPRDFFGIITDSELLLLCVRGPRLAQVTSLHGIGRHPERAISASICSLASVLCSLTHRAHRLLAGALSWRPASPKLRPCPHPPSTSSAAASPARRPRGRSRRPASPSCCTKCGPFAAPRRIRRMASRNSSAPTPSAPTTPPPTRSACCTRKCAAPAR